MARSAFLQPAQPSFHFDADLPPRSLAQSLARHLLDRLHACLPPQGAAQRLAAIGLSPESFRKGPTLLTYNDLSGLYRQVAVAMDDEMLGLWNRPLRIGVLRLLLRVSVEADTMREALSRLAGAYSLLLDDFALVLVEGKQVLRLELRPRKPGVTADPLAQVLTLRLIMGICDWLTGRRLPIGAISTVFARTAALGDLEDFLTCRVEHGAAVTALAYRAEIGAVPLVGRHTQISEFVDRAPRIWLHDEPVGEMLELRVREMLIRDLNRPLEDVARVLNLSPRTLIRRLRSDNLTFRTLRNDLRQEWAMRELTSSTGSLDAISYALGFSSPSAFQRAFRQWTGMSPGVFRAERRHGANGRVAPRLQ